MIRGREVLPEGERYQRAEDRGQDLFLEGGVMVEDPTLPLRKDVQEEKIPRMKSTIGVQEEEIPRMTSTIEDRHQLKDEKDNLVALLLNPGSERNLRN